MASCGIKKYDDLPARVGWGDVDALRSSLSFDLWLMKKFSKLVAWCDGRIKHKTKKLDFYLEQHKSKRARDGW